MSDGAPVACDRCGQAALNDDGASNDDGVCGNCVSIAQDPVESSDPKTTPPTDQDDAVKKKAYLEAEAVIDELAESHRKLQEKAKMAIASLKLLLEQKEADLLACYKAIFDYKVGILNEYKTRASSSPSEDTPPLPPLAGGIHCGFLPEMTNLVHSAASLVLEHQGEMEEGEEMRVSVIGSLGKDGRFWVRILPDDMRLQDVMLQNLSNTIGVELSMSTLDSLRSANVGDLCCALYSEDQRWYRARVVEVLKNQLKARVYFLDYGNTETISFSSLSQLHPKFLVYPFQMIQCCFSIDKNLIFDREVKWKFTDLTHGSNLKVKVLQNLHDDIHGRLHLVQLTNISGAEPFDVGKSIVVMAGIGPQQPNPIKYRDIRYAGATPSTTQKTPPTVTTTLQSPQSSEATPTITIEMPSGKPQPEDPVVPAQQLTPTQSHDSGLPSQSPQEESVSSLTHSASILSSSSSSSSNAVITSSSSQNLDKSPSSVTEVSDGSGEVGVANSEGSGSVGVASSEEGSGNVGVASSEGSGNVGVASSEGSGEVGVAGSKEETEVQISGSDDKGGVDPASSGNDIIESAAQIKVDQSVETAAAESGSHSPIPPTQSGSHSPIPPAQSGSHSPIPVSVAGDQKTAVSISVEVESKSVPCEAVPTSECSLELKPGDTMEVYATSPLSQTGSFWLQLASAGEAEFQKMVDQLQKSCQEEPPTPVFFSAGDICAAQFSEDSCWYRAKVEGVIKDKFLVHYLDFGNSEEREQHFLMALRSEFRILPFQAFQCSIACQDHTSFSDKEIACFARLTTSETLTAKIVEEKEAGVFGVDLLRMLPSGPLDVGEEVFAVGVEFGESISFSLDQDQQEVGSKSTKEPPRPVALSTVMNDGVSGQASWADSMDDIQSPHNDGVFTLAGQDSRDHTPTPASLRPSPPPQRSSPAPAPRISSPSPHHSSPTPTPHFSPAPRRSSPSPRRSSPAPPSHRSTPPPPRPQSHAPFSQDSTQERGVSKNSSQRIRASNPNGPVRGTSAPRIQMDALGIVRKTLLTADRSREKKERAKSEQPSTAKLGPDASSGPSLPPGLPQPKGIHSINQVSRNGTSFPPMGRRRKSPEPEHSQIMDKEGGLRAIEGLNGSHLMGSPKPLTVQPYKVSSVSSPEQADFDCLSSSICTRLFVKNVPLDRTMEQVKEMFAQFGRVIGVVPVPSRKNVVYMYMDPEGASVAIDHLYGKAVAKHSKPLIVEVSQPPRKNQSRS